MVCPELTEQIRREIAASLHQRKGDFACYFLTDLVTFTLPAGTQDILTITSFRLLVFLAYAFSVYLCLNFMHMCIITL